MSVKNVIEASTKSLKNNDQSIASLKNFLRTAFCGLSVNELIKVAEDSEKIEKTMVHKTGEFIKEPDTLTQFQNIDNILKLCTLLGAQQMFGTAIESILERCNNFNEINQAASDVLDSVKDKQQQDLDEEA